MTAPSRINVKGDTLSVYWRNEADADWGQKAFFAAAHPKLTDHEMTMRAPASDRTMAGLHMPSNVEGVDYGSTLRIFGTSEAVVRLTQQRMANERAGNALGDLGITGDGLNHSTAHAAAAGIAQESARSL